MGHVSLFSSKRSAQQWRLLDFVSALLFAVVVVFFLLILTPLGDSLASSGRHTLSTVDPRQRQRLLEAIESSRVHIVEACLAEDVDHMPCEDPRRNSQLSRSMNYYRERHCPLLEEVPFCLIPPPNGYRIPVQWPDSLHKIWYDNMPHNKIAKRKGHQGWMKMEGRFFIFPGGGTMFPDGAVRYIEKLGQYIPLTDGSLRTALDIGCGVASFGGSLLEKGILTLSFAPRDSHKSQIQFALERGIPALVAMLGTRRLPFPSSSFDFLHCSRCLIPFTAYNATYFIEVDRLLRPGGYLVISGPPVQWPKQDKEWGDLQDVARALCYELIAVDGNTVIWKKPFGDLCFPAQNEFGIRLCEKSDDPDFSWYFKLRKCVSRASPAKGGAGAAIISKWPDRLTNTPPRASAVRNGADVFPVDYMRWKRRVVYYKETLGLGIGTPSVRNVMDMNAFFGGFAAALVGHPVWVMNVVPVGKLATLGTIFDRGLIGVYHDWCEPFSTYPRTYDLIHVSNIATLVKHSDSDKNRCDLIDLMVEMDRMLRPEGTVVIRDKSEVINRALSISHALRWNPSVHETEAGSKGQELILVSVKTFWKLP